ncbi:MAG: NRDE family protein [Desulfuromonadales bacterium]|nr:NRDE family protein [Desulfuromonadales bacterium]
MCLILVAHQRNEQLPLLVLANRDEFYARPTAAAQPWAESPGMIAGRDLVSGGTWFGARNARWATVTNIREGLRDKENHSSKSRGWLVRDYLQGELSPADFLASIETTIGDFAGFNLLLGDGRELWYASSRTSGARLLPPGVYGLSNHLLDTPWPKVVRGKAGVNQLLNQSPFNQEAAFTLLSDPTRAIDTELPDTGIPLDWERALSAIFISLPEYGTRCSTLLKVNAEGRRLLVERRFADGPRHWSASEFTWGP